MATNAKQLRNKALADMSAQELKDFISKGEKSGLSLSTSKELGKAQNLLKVLEPEGYGAKQVESAKTSLQTQSSIPTLEKLGISVPDWKKQQAGIATPTAGATGTTGGLTAGMTQTAGVSSSPFQTPDVITAQKELDALVKQKNEALAQINDNPFYSEGTRSGKVNRLNDKFSQELALAQTKLTTAQTNAQNAYKAQQDALSNNREILKTYISTGALAGATEAELVAISKATGYPMGVLRGAIQQIQFDRQQKVQTTTDKYAYDWNKVDSKIKGIALQTMKEQDVIKGGQADGYLDAAEYAEVVDAVAAEVGDIDLAEKIVIESMERNGYYRWGETKVGQPISVNYQGLNNRTFA